MREVVSHYRSSANRRSCVSLLFVFILFGAEKCHTNYLEVFLAAFFTIFFAAFGAFSAFGAFGTLGASSVLTPFAGPIFLAVYAGFENGESCCRVFYDEKAVSEYGERIQVANGCSLHIT